MCKNKFTKANAFSDVRKTGPNFFLAFLMRITGTPVFAMFDSLYCKIT